MNLESNITKLVVDSLSIEDIEKILNAKQKVAETKPKKIVKGSYEDLYNKYQKLLTPIMYDRHNLIL